MRRLTVAAMAAVGIAIGPASGARAQCDPPADLVQSVPVDGATGVPTDALLHGWYGSGASYGGEPVLLDGPDGTTMPLAFFDGATGALIVTPETLRPRTSYTVRWPALFPAGGGEAGGAGASTFTTGDGLDAGPPRLEAIDAIAWDAVGSRDACTDSRQDRWTFTLDLVGLGDDGGIGAMEVVVFQTVRPDGDDPEPDVVGVDAIEDEGGPHRVTVRLARDRGLGRVCFRAIARDLVDHASSSTADACATTRAPPFFDGCSAAGPGARGAGAVLVLVTSWACSRRRRSRSPGRRGAGTRRAA